MGMTNTGARPSLAPPSRVEHRLTANADIVGQLLHTMNNFNAGIMPAIVPLKTLVPNYHFLIIRFSDPSLITILDHLSPLGHCLVCLCTTNIFPQLTMRKYHY